MYICFVSAKIFFKKTCLKFPAKMFSDGPTEGYSALEKKFRCLTFYVRFYQPILYEGGVVCPPPNTDI